MKNTAKGKSLKIPRRIQTSLFQTNCSGRIVAGKISFFPLKLVSANTLISNGPSSEKNQRHPVILFMHPVVAFGNQLTTGICACEHAELRVKAKIMQFLKLFPVEIRRDHYLGAVKASQSRQSPVGRHFS